MIEVHGRSGITAKIIADSINSSGDRITTYELEYPRWILAELDTHRMLSKNTASSRAVPISSVLEQVANNTAMPVEWGTNNPGMVSNDQLDDARKSSAEMVWRAAARAASSFAEIIGDKANLNIHKQLTNRLTETFTMSKTVLTGTEFANFFNLRDHADAQPEFRELAKCMREAMVQSTPMKLNAGQWHLPYIEFSNGKYYASGAELDLETAKRVSASCCAQVSYRKLDDSIDKAIKVFDMLKLSDPNYRQKHSSPSEHQATPMDDYSRAFHACTWQPGITHVRRDGSLWSGNFRGWIQFRQLIPNESVAG